MPNAGGTPTTTDIYNAVKQALIDAGNSGLGQFAAGTDVNGSGVDVGNSNGTYGTGAGNGTDVNPAQGVDDDVVSTRNTAESRISTTVFSISAMPTPALPVPATGCYTYDTSFDWPSATGSVHQAVHWDWTRHASQIGLIRNGCSFAISIMGLFWIISIIRSAIA
jgi:hypothetical protein